MPQDRPTLPSAISALLGAHVDAALAAARQASSNAGAAAGIAFLAYTACLVVLSAGVVAAAPVIGLAWALLLAGLVILAMAGGAALWARSRRQDREHELAAARVRVEVAEQRVQAALAPPEPAPGADAGGSLLPRLTTSILAHPQATLTAVAAIVSAVGPIRAFRIISRVVAAGGTLAALLRGLRDFVPRDPGDAAPARPAPPEAARPAAPNGFQARPRHTRDRSVTDPRVL